MSNKAAISLTTGMEDPEKVMIALLMAVGAAESGRPTMMFLAKEAVRLVVPGVAIGTSCQGCPDLPGLLERYAKAGGKMLVCPICINAKGLEPATFPENVTPGGTVQLWEWIGDEAASCFSY